MYFKQNNIKGSDLEFPSYTQLKRYQKKARLFTGSVFSTAVSVFVVIVAIQIMFPGDKSQGATYFWTQTAWKSVPTGALASHPTDKESTFTDYTSKDPNLAVQNPDTADSTLTLSTNAGNIKQTDATTTSTGFNLAGRDFGGNTVVNSVGDPKITITPQGAVTTPQIVLTRDGRTNCVLSENGTIFCSGANDKGQLGNNSAVANSTTPVQVVGEGGVGYLTGVGSLTAARDTFCALKLDGSIYCWGWGLNGQLGNGTSADINKIPVRVLKGQAAAADIDGTNTYLSNIKLVTGGEYSHMCALSNSGNAYCWGYNTGQLGDGTNGTNRNTPVRVLKGQAAAADIDGTNTYLTNIKSLPTGFVNSHMCALSNAGNLYCWGRDAQGGLGNGGTSDVYVPQRVLKGQAAATDIDGTNTYLANVKSIEVVGSTYGSTCAVSNADNIYCWGAGSYGQLGNGGAGGNSSSPVRIVKGQAAAGDIDGTNTYLANIDKLAVSGNYLDVCAISKLGNLYCWGAGSYGQLGYGGTSSSISSPVRVLKGQAASSDIDGTNTYLTNIKNAATYTGNAGHPYACAFSNSNNIYCWGDNTGNVGDGTVNEKDVPARVVKGQAVAADIGDGAYLANIRSGYASSSGNATNCALTNSGNVYCWGGNSLGQSGNGNTSALYSPAQMLGVGGTGTLSLNVVLTYNSPGVFTSGVIDTHQPNQSWGALTWNETLNGLPAGSIKVRARSCNDSACVGEDTGKDFTTKCTDINNGANLPTGGCVTAGDQYVQYQATLTTNVNTVTPSLDDITVNYNYYPTNQTLVSSVYNTGSNTNVMKGVLIKGGLGAASGTEIKAQMRSAADTTSLASKPWCGATSCDNADTFNFTAPTSMPGQNIDLPANHPIITTKNDDQYFQYKIILNSAGDKAPTVESVGASYIINAPPEVRSVAAAENSDGTVTVDYETRDPDTSTGATNGLVVAGLEYCTANCASSGSEVWAQAAALVFQNGDGSALADNKNTVEESAWHAYRMVWNAKQEYNGNFNANFKVRVKVDDSEQANRYGYGSSANFSLDTKNPTGVSFTIDRTQGKLFLATPNDNSSYQMAVSNTSGGLDSASFSAFQSSVTYANFTDDPATVYLRIKDAYGNYTDTHTTTPAKPQSVVYYDVSNSSANDYREFIAWNVISPLQSGSGFSGYKIFRSTDGVNFSPIVNAGNPITDRNTNYFIDTNLAAATHYYYKIETIDTAGNISQFSSVVDDTPDGQGGTDQTPPTITQVHVSAINTTSATVTWKTDELSDSSVGYSTDASYLPERGLSSMVLDHTVTLTGLTPGTIYNVQIKSRDNASNLATNNKDNPGNSSVSDFTFSTLPGPSISNVTIPEVSNTQATVSWITNTNSSTYAVYSDTISNGELLDPIEIGTPDLVGGNAPYVHNQTILNLEAGRAYYFEVKSVDGSGNVAIDNNGGSYYMLTTTMDNEAPSITADDNNPLVLTDMQAAVGFSTSEKAVGRIGYKKTSEGAFTYMEWGTSYNTSHIFVIPSLEKSTTYDYVFEAKDINGNLASSQMYQFATKQSQVDHPDLTDPGSPTVLQKSESEAVVALSGLNTEATAKLCYSKTAISNVDTCAQSADSSIPSKTHIFHISGLEPSTVYHLKVKTTDSLSGPVTFVSSDSVFSTLSLPPGPDALTAPGDPVLMTNSDTDAVVYIPVTNMPATSKLCYGTSPITDIATCAGALTIDTATRTHTYHLTDLAPSTAHYVRMRVTDANDPLNFFDSSELQFSTKDPLVEHADLTQPQDPQELAVSDATAIITQKTNTQSSAKVCYSESAISDQDRDACFAGQNVAGVTLITDPDITNTHNFQLADLAADTTYHYRVYVEDSVKTGINFSSADKTFKTKKVQVDQHDSLSSISTPKDTDISTSTNFAFISWSTDQLANSYVGCSTIKNDPDFPQIFNQNLVDYQSSHTLKLLNLATDTKYYCKVKSTDNLSPSTTKTSDEFSFTTQKDASVNHDPLAAITFAETTPSVLTDTDAVISFSTDQAANCFLEYGTTAGTYDSIPVKERSDTFNQNHSLHLAGLLFKMQYFYKVTCQDNLKTIVSSDERNFTTLDKLMTQQEANESGDRVPPVISNVKTSSIGGESATITWDTDEKSNSIMRYGTDVSLSDMAGNGDVASDVEKYVTNHQIDVRNLIPSTKYYFSILSMDAAGNISESPTGQFSTASPSSLSSIKAESSVLGEATISWETNTNTTSTVEYGLTTSYGEKKESSTLTKKHLIGLSNLNQGVVYHYRVKGKDSNGVLYASSDQTFQPKSPPQVSNISIGDISEHGAAVTFKTSVPTDSDVSYADVENKDNTNSQGNPRLVTEHRVELSKLDSGKTYAVKLSVRDEQGTEAQVDAPDFTTAKDENPPKIDNVKTDSALTQNDKVQTIVSWKTDELSTTSLLYKEGRSGQEKELVVSDDLTDSHVAVVTVFKPGTVYGFKVKSVDASGNIAASNDFALLTPRRRENIIQIIVGNFQDIFKWAKF